MAHEMTPTDGAIANRGRMDAMAIKNIPDGGLRDLEAQFDEFTLDFAIPPTEIFYSQTEYQAFKFMRDLRTSSSVSVWIGPFLADEFLVQRSTVSPWKMRMTLRRCAVERLEIRFSFLVRKARVSFSTRLGLTGELSLRCRMES
jgi:hypothetical protein